MYYIDWRWWLNGPICGSSCETGALKTTSRANGATIKSFSINVIAFSLSLYMFFSASELLLKSSHSISIYYPHRSLSPILPFSHLQASTIAIKAHFSRVVPVALFSPSQRSAIFPVAFSILSRFLIACV